ncbi:MAG TPA: adenosylmethionine decarboxylase [Steroidobacteraceae bacterium]|jgi:S-adenosylmethionine decarboxylase|nr:adenosylmethionine decarboxylase [Steroidobacteraceae bacterium]
MSGRSVAPAGKHWLVEMYQTPELDDVARIRRALRHAVAESGVRMIRLQLHHFGVGRGVTGVALLAQSHISIHTWPERRYAALDIFMCGSKSNPRKALDALREALAPGRVRVRRFRRGLGRV